MFFQSKGQVRLDGFSIIFMCLIILMVITTSCMTKTKPLEKSSAQQLIGKITKVQHTATKNNQVKLSIGDVIAKGDTIQTLEGTRIELLMTDGTVVTLGQRTELHLNQYNFQPDISTGELFFEIKKGDFAIKTGKLSKQKKKQFSIRTAMALISVRGTTFWGGSLDGISFDVALLEGQSVIISNQGGEVQIKDIGFGTTLKNYLIAPTKPKKWPQHKIDRALETVTFK